LTRIQEGLLKRLTGDYILVRHSGSGHWIITKEHCRKGLPPINDPCYMARLDDRYFTIKDIISRLLAQGYSRDKIKAFDGNTLIKEVTDEKNNKPVQ